MTHVWSLFAINAWKFPFNVVRLVATGSAPLLLNKQVTGLFLFSFLLIQTGVKEEFDHPCLLAFDIISSGNQPWNHNPSRCETRLHGKLLVSGFLRTGYHWSTPCLCLLCERGSSGGMWELRRGIYPTSSSTISYIPHQSRPIRWPCLLFGLFLSHQSDSVTHILFLSAPFNSLFQERSKIHMTSESKDRGNKRKVWDKSKTER